MDVEFSEWLRQQTAALTDEQREGLARLTQREALEFERSEGRFYDYVMAAIRRAGGH